MNLRNVLRAYGLLRQLSDDESALLNILRALNDNDREQLVATMSDKPQKKSSKKATVTAREYDHCLRCGTTKRDPSHKNQSSPDYHEFQSSKDSGKVPAKSKRASGMAAQLNKQLDGRRKEPEIGGFADDTDMIRCTYQYPKDGPVNSGLTCNELPTDTIHDKSFGYAGYHVYQPPASSAAGSGG